VLQVGSLPDIKVRYDSSEALYLRKALNPRFAPHRAILRKSANPGAHLTAAAPQFAIHMQSSWCFVMQQQLPILCGILLPTMQLMLRWVAVVLHLLLLAQP
jgi:hypothetical protein